MNRLDNSTERLFLALWPTPKVRQQIHQLSRLIIPVTTGKILPAENWHITLIFIGNFDSAAKPCIQQVAAGVAANRFSLSLERLGYWPKNQILWLGASQTPSALLELVSNLSAGLPNCGYRPEQRSFQTHLTLMRKARLTSKTLPAIQPITWQVKDFCLVRSITYSSGASYQVIARWLLSSKAHTDT